MAHCSPTTINHQAASARLGTIDQLCQEQRSKHPPTQHHLDDTAPRLKNYIVIPSGVIKRGWTITH
jgi:predicted NBD/HSP70 family sugar kinase